MKGKGPKHERETVIRFDEETQTASVWTASELTYRRLLKLGYMPASESDRSVTFEIPKRDIKLPRPKRTITEAQRERLQQMRPRRDKTTLAILPSEL
jgi:hypothetical protein